MLGNPEYQLNEMIEILVMHVHQLLKLPKDITGSAAARITAPVVCQNDIIRSFLLSSDLVYSAKRGFRAIIIHQPETIITETFCLLLKTNNIVIMNNNMHSLGFLHPSLVSKV